MRIIFMGTPDFAVPSLSILHNSGYKIVAVITSTDKLGGRGGKQLLESPIKKYAQSQNLKVLQPRNLKNPEFIDELRDLKADLQIVVAFRMLPEIVWNMPPMGTYNLHGSLLPKYRGAAPINWAIIQGEKETGVSFFKLKHEIDTGDILLQETFKIHRKDNAGLVHNKMMYMGAKVVLEGVQKIECGELDFKSQDQNLVTKAPKLYPDTCKIDLSQSIEEVNNFIRGLSPYPAAWTILKGKKLKIFGTDIEMEIDPSESVDEGIFVTDKKNFLALKCKDGLLGLSQIQLEGKRKMRVKEFLNGYSFTNQ